MNVVNEASQSGQEIEILDNTVYEKEQNMIFQALLEEKNNEIFDHDELWGELLK